MTVHPPGVFMKLKHFVRILVLVAITAAVTMLLGPAARAQRAITIEDYFQIREVHDPQLSPDGQWIAYSVKTPLLKDDKNEERIWMVAASGGEPIALTTEGNSSSHPRWSPDGKYIAFLSARNEGKTQVWLLNRMGGEAERLTDTPQDVDSFEWSPDGKRLCLILRDATTEELAAAKDKENDKEDGDKPAKVAKEKKHKAQKPWVIDRLQ